MLKQDIPISRPYIGYNEYKYTLKSLIQNKIGGAGEDNKISQDIIANTVVIYLKDEVKFSETILENISETYVPTYPNVIKLSDNDARIIKNTFQSASKFNDYKTLIKLRSKILEVTEIKSVHKTDKEFIDAVLKDYNFYTQNM